MRCAADFSLPDPSLNEQNYAAMMRQSICQAAPRMIMKRNVGLKILNCAAALVTLGGCFDMLIPAVPSNLVGYLKIATADVSPQLSSLLLGLLRALGGCLLAVGITALLIINGPLKRGERWASWALLILIGLSEGINASQMWRFGSPYYWPLVFVALTVIGVVILRNQSETKLL